MLYQEMWPRRPGAAPPEAPKNWGTGAYNTIIFGTTHDLCILYKLKLAAPQKGFSLATPFFEYSERLLRQKMGGACLYMHQDGHWLASFEVIPPLSRKRLVFPRPKNEHSPLKTVFLIQISF